MGNEAIARGAWEAGVKVAAAYPGTPSTEIMESLGKYPAEDLQAEWATNEKVALDVAIGASFAGARALTSMKHVGLNVAADALMSQTYIGVNGGLVLVVCDDPGIHSSQNEQDTRIYGHLAMVPILEPADAQEALEFTRLAFDLSESFDTPVIVRGTTRLSHTRSLVRTGARSEKESRGFDENPQKNVMIPGHARLRHSALFRREERLKQYLEESDLIRWEPGSEPIGIVTLSTAYTYVKELLPRAHVLKLGASYPLPTNRLREFCDALERVIVIEELEPIVENEMKLMGLHVEGKSLFPREGEFSPDVIRAGLETQTGGGRARHAEAAAIVRRLPAYRGLYGLACAQRACLRRHRLLHVGGGRTAQGDRYHGGDGIEHRQRHRNGAGGQRDAPDCRHHRRFDLFACRDSAVDQCGLQPGKHHRGITR